MDIPLSVTIDKIINIPIDFHTSQTKSWNTLLEESGYFENYYRIKLIDLANALKQSPNLISSWLQWSEDQRCTPTWVFSKGESGNYHVDHIPKDKKYEELSTNDEYYACAVFINYLIQSTREHLINGIPYS